VSFPEKKENRGERVTDKSEKYELRQGRIFFVCYSAKFVEEEHDDVFITGKCQNIQPYVHL